MNSKQPFFSIVIPTKNRPEYLRDSIQSVLLQDFTDYELIVSDNFNETPTEKVLEEFRSHSKVRVFRTPKELSMIDHWEFATKKVKGEYVILLADRKLLYQGALKKIKVEVLKNPEVQAFSFRSKIYDDENKKMGWQALEHKTKVYQSSELIENFLNTNYYSLESLDFMFPKTLNGCYKNNLAKKAREITGRYFDNEGVTTPDYSSLFINLALTERVMHIGQKIMLWQGEKTSNGRQFGKGKYKAYMSTLNLHDPYVNVPIKAPFTYNLLIVDFLSIKELFGGNLTQHNINYNNYLYTIYWELLTKSEFDMDVEDLNYFKREFEEGLAACESKEHTFSKNQTEFQFKVPVLQNRFDKFFNFRKHLRDYVTNRFPNSKIANKVLKTHYKSSLHAAGFDVNFSD